MTTAKLDSKAAAAAADGLEPYVGRLYARLGTRIVGVVELAAVERNDLSPDVDKEPWVKLRIMHLEIARDEQEEPVRQALRALKLHRTATGTLDEEGEVNLAKSTLEQTGGLLHAIEAARLRTAVEHWRSYIRRVLAIDNVSTSEMRHELDIVANGLDAVLSGPGQGELPLNGGSE